MAHTSPSPLGFEVARATGCSLFDKKGKEYIDLIGGISVANTGHGHPAVREAIKKQVDEYLHVMVYGEFIESPQVQYAKLLTEHLPASLHSVYFTNSGTEAAEGAMKLAKKYTGRTQIIAFKNSYHGSTQGALSMIGNEYWRNAFRPLLPDILHLEYDSPASLEEITERTACVVAETIQAEAGIRKASEEWMLALREKCSETGSLLVLDEIQTGFGRTGSLWGFEHFNIVPDILLLGKALGGGMPLGAFIADKRIMDVLADKPALGHITTFGGHPVCCAAGRASMKVLLDEGWMDGIGEKENLFLERLHHRKIKAVRSCGLWLAVEFDSFDTNKKIIDACIEGGVMTDWFMFNSSCLRISPPLVISAGQAEKACGVIIKACDEC